MPGTVVEEFQSHNVWKQLAELEAALARTQDQLANVEPDVVSLHASLTALADYVRAVLQNANPVLIPTQLLEAIDSSLTQTCRHVTTFADSDDVSHLEQAWATAPQVLTSLSGLPTIKTRKDTKGLASAITAFEDQLTARVDTVAANTDEIAATLTTLEQREAAVTTEIEQQKGQLTKALNTFQTQFATEQEARATEYETALQEVQNALTSAEEKHADLLANDQKLRTAQMDDFAQRFQTLQDECDEQAQDAATERATQAEQRLQELAEHLAQAKHLVEMIGEVTMTGHYQKNAIEQQKTADYWRWATVGASGLAILSAIVVVVVGMTSTDEQWFDQVTRIGVTLALAGLAAFLGSQSIRHRRREETYRALELELATLDPFLVTLDDDQRRQLKTRLAMRYFVGIKPNAVGFDDPQSDT